CRQAALEPVRAPKGGACDAGERSLTAAATFPDEESKPAPTGYSLTLQEQLSRTVFVAAADRLRWSP
ncbi:hypothetical protein M5G11_11825, partial [Pseudomonas sp. TNT2022 ID681]